MKPIRHALACFVAAFLLTGLAALASTPGRPNPKDVIEDTATRQAQLKRAFEGFRIKLAVLAGRLENGSPEEKKKAEALKKSLKLISDLGTTGRFDSVITGLTKKNADQNLDVLGQIVKDNKELRQDLQKIIAMLLDSDNAKKMAQRKERLKQLLELLKDVRDKQARLQARTEMGKDDPKELTKPQEKVTEQTKNTLDPKENPTEQEIEEIETVRKPVDEAVKEQKEAGKQLAASKGMAAGQSQGKAISKLDEAIKKLEDLLKQQREEERQQKLADLLARCKRMLAQQIEVRDATEKLDKEIRNTAEKKPTLIHAARGTRLADQQLVIVRDCAAALKLVKSEETAVVFAEILENVHGDMDTIHSRLERTDVGTVTQTIENDVIATLQDIIKALEKALQEPQEGQGGGGGGGKKDPKLVSFLQQLKMILAMQRRINQRTELYGKTYHGEQAPIPENAKDAKEKELIKRVRKELTDLSDRQERLSKVTREVSRQPEARNQ